MRGRIVLVVVSVALALAATMPLAGASSHAKKKTPKACLDALDSAEHVVSHSADYAQLVSDYLTGLHDAAVRSQAESYPPEVLAMLVAFVDEQNGLVETLTNGTEALVPKVQEAVADYNAAAAKCRAKA